MKQSKKIKAEADRATMLGAAMFIVMHPEPPKVQGASIAALTSAWLMCIDKRDRSAALQHLHGTVANMTADMEKEEEKAMRK